MKFLNYSFFMLPRPLDSRNCSQVISSTNNIKFIVSLLCIFVTVNLILIQSSITIP